MKLTEAKIKQIILEELENLTEEDKMTSDDKEKVKDNPDVAIVMKQMTRINNHLKYSQLMQKMLNWDFGDPQRKDIILKDLRNSINKLLSGK